MQSCVGLADPAGICCAVPKCSRAGCVVLLPGAVASLIAKVDSIIAKNGQNGFAVSSKLSVADVFVFAMTTAFVSGTFDGVPTDLFDKFSNIQTVRRTVASLPFVAEYYSQRTDAGSRFVTQGSANACVQDLIAFYVFSAGNRCRFHKQTVQQFVGNV